MLEPMTVRAEVWPVAADEIGIWLASGPEPWLSAPVMADSEPHAEVELELATRDVADMVALLHSTSWRADGPHLIVTYMAVLRVPGLVREVLPRAVPVCAELAGEVGKPPTHAPTEAPAPRYIDVLMHGLRHLRWLADPRNDATSSAAFPAHWHKHLEPLAPVLATMYDEAHKAAS